MDTGYPDISSETSGNALFRAAEALYWLRQYKKACTVLELLCGTCPENQDGTKFLHRAQARLIEQTTGQYSFKKLQEEAKNLRPPFLDHASFTGSIESRQSASRG